MIKITDVNISSDYSWGEIRNLNDWNSFKNTNMNWQKVNQTAIVGHVVLIEVNAVEYNWEGLMSIHKSWLDIMNNYSNWNDVKNF